MTPYDALYVPRDTAVSVAPSSQGCDLAEISAPVSMDPQRLPVFWAFFQLVSERSRAAFSHRRRFRPPGPRRP